MIWRAPFLPMSLLHYYEDLTTSTILHCQITKEPSSGSLAPRHSAVRQMPISPSTTRFLPRATSFVAICTSLSLSAVVQILLMSQRAASSTQCPAILTLRTTTVRFTWSPLLDLNSNISSGSSNNSLGSLSGVMITFTCCCSPPPSEDAEVG